MSGSVLHCLILKNLFHGSFNLVGLIIRKSRLLTLLTDRSTNHIIPSASQLQKSS